MARSLTSWSISAAFSRLNVHSYNSGTYVWNLKFTSQSGIVKTHNKIYVITTQLSLLITDSVKHICFTSSMLLFKSGGGSFQVSNPICGSHLPFLKNTRKKSVWVLNNFAAHFMRVWRSPHKMLQPKWFYTNETLCHTFSYHKLLNLVLCTQLCQLECE